MSEEFFKPIGNGSQAAAAAGNVPPNAKLKIVEAKDEEGEVMDVGVMIEAELVDESAGVNICKQAFENIRKYILIKNKIQRRYDGIETPYSPGKLKELGKGWKSNFNTLFMKGLVDRVSPKMSQYVKSLKYLSFSEMPAVNLLTKERIDNNIEKTEILRSIFTKYVRRWPKFNPTIDIIASHTTLYGLHFACWLDETEWRPKVYRIDDLAIPAGTSPLDDDISFFVTRETYMPHELVQNIRDTESAKLGGWNIENVVKAVNEAAPISAVSDNNGNTDSMRYEDMIKEASPAWSYYKGMSVIECYHLYIKRVDGKVDMYVYTVMGGKQLRYLPTDKERVYDFITPFGFEGGQKTFYQNYGIGNMITDLSSRVEKTRNEAIDQFANRGKIIVVYKDEQAYNNARTFIVDDIMQIVGGEIAGNQAALPGSAENFVQLDRYFTEISERLVGAFIPPLQMSGNPRTATEAQLAAQREQEMSSFQLSNWLQNVTRMLFNMQRRMFSQFSIDPIAKLAREEALLYVSEEELELWANAEPYANPMDYSENSGREIAAWAQANLGNPAYDQQKLLKLRDSVIVGTDVSQQVLIPQEDQTIMAEAVRMQTMEQDSLSKGVGIPISPRDNDVIHMQVIEGQPDQTGSYTNSVIYSYIQQGNIEGAKQTLQHYVAHVDSAAQKKSLGEGINEKKRFVADAAKAIQDVEVAIMKQQQEMMMAQQQAAPQNVIPMQ